MRQTRAELLLPDHHLRIEQLLEDVKIEVRKDDPRALCAYWSRFEHALNDHMAAEEQLLLDAYADEVPADAAALHAEHDAFRARLFEMGMEVDMHCLHVDEIDELVEQLRAHARHEDAGLYPWAIRHAPGPFVHPANAY